MWAKLRRALPWLRGRPHVTPELAVPFERIGSDYGGYAVIPERLRPGCVVYSFGVGEDISFDLGVIARAGAVVHAFDPTPRAQAWIAGQALPPSFHMHPYAVGATDGVLRLYPPRKKTHVSYSEVRRGAASDPPVEARCLRLRTIMAELGHARIDVLKMDIEGSEYAVLADLVACAIGVGQLLVEFHHDHPGYAWADTERAIAALGAAGYRSFYVSPGGQELSFVRA